MSRNAISAIATVAILAGVSTSALALTITPTFDSTITSLSNASTVEAAFQQAASNLDALFVNPVTVDVNVSWGSVAGQSLPSSALGASISSLYGYYSYAQIASMLKNTATTAADRSAYASLPASAPAGQSRYAITSAQAKALGIVSPTGGTDGSIGFGGSASTYTFGETNGIAPGTHDFISVAEHELTEVLGRISGLSSTTPRFATIEDLFRFSGTGTRAWSYNTSSYFSIDNGATDLANYNHSSNGGDRADWLSTPSTTDSADAFTYSGKIGVLSSLDQTVLDVIGWGSSGTGSGGASAVSTIKGAADAVSTPEPASLALLSIATMAALGARRRRR